MRSCSVTWPMNNEQVALRLNVIGILYVSYRSALASGCGVISHLALIGLTTHLRENGAHWTCWRAWSSNQGPEDGYEQPPRGHSQGMQPSTACAPGVSPHLPHSSYA